jgi:hypothetical protein
MELDRVGVDVEPALLEFVPRSPRPSARNNTRQRVR